LNLSYFHDKNGGALLALASQFLISPLLLADAAQIKADTVAGNYLVGSTIKLAPTLEIAKFLESYTFALIPSKIPAMILNLSKKSSAC